VQHSVLGRGHEEQTPVVSVESILDTALERFHIEGLALQHVDIHFEHGLQVNHIEHGPPVDRVLDRVPVDIITFLEHTHEPVDMDTTEIRDQIDPRTHPPPEPALQRGRSS
jgi:hypothetical protein